MLVKNGEYIGTVSNLGANGEGVVKNDDAVVFVPFSLTGEKIRYKVIKVSSKGNFGKLIEVIEPSKDRVEPKCKVFYKCGGCDLQHLKYEKQLELKQNNIEVCFKKIANLDIEVSDVVCGEKQFAYRNKLQLPVQFDGVKNIFGFYSQNSHRVIDIDACPINPEWAEKIIAIFKEFMDKNNLKGLSVNDFSGDIREITVKEAENKLIITVVGLKKQLKHKEELIRILTQKLDCEFSLFYNQNDSTSNVIYSDNFSLLYGKETIETQTEGIIHSVGVRSFSQVNNEVCSLLYNRVIKELTADNLTNTTVFDAYSGAGLMTAMIGKYAKKVIGMEIVKEAVEIANELMIKNGLNKKVKNYCGKCEDLLPKLIKEEREKNNNISVVLDPPRRGCDIKVLDAIININVDKIIYVSCMPSTLARDVGILVGSLTYYNNEIKKAESFTPRYKIESATPFEMFPETKHVETLCVLQKTKSL